MTDFEAPESGKLQAPSPAPPGPAAVPFAGLADLHYRWRMGLETSVPDLDARATSYQEARAAFEAEHGTIVNEYWCWHVPSAVALTERPRPGVISQVLRPTIAFHRATDWATKDHPDVAELLHRCDEVAVKATQVLSGLRRRICLHLVMTSAAHLLSFVDAKAAHERSKDVVDKATEVLEQERKALAKTEAYYRGAANGQAQIVYFSGMAAVAAVLGTLALLGSWWISLPGIDEDREFYGCLAAGALGAVVSVIQRINSGQFDLTYDVGSPYVTFLGGLRPVLGAGFGLIFYFAATSGLLNIFTVVNEDDTNRFFSFLVIAFLAGFSERWAQDTLTSLGQGSGKTDQAAQQPEGSS